MERAKRRKYQKKISSLLKISSFGKCLEAKLRDSHVPSPAKINVTPKGARLSEKM